MFAVGIAMDEAVAAALHAARRASSSSRSSNHDRGRYLNFTERPTDTRVAYSEAAYARLQEAKAKWDSDEPLQRKSPDPGSRRYDDHAHPAGAAPGRRLASPAVRSSDTESREFHGWLGLIGAIEALFPRAGEARGHADRKSA